LPDMTQRQFFFIFIIRSKGRERGRQDDRF